MKIALTAAADGMNAPLNERFGRAPGFIVYDTDTQTHVFIDNQSADAAQGAGIKAAEIVAKAGATALVTGDCGPKAFAALKRAGIGIFSHKGGSVQNALDLFLAGKLKEISVA